MSDTIVSYVNRYGNVSLKEAPLNDVDSLVLCQLAYLKFDGIVPGVNENKPSISIQQIREHPEYENLYGDERYERSNRALFDAVRLSKRFGKMKLNCHINIIETKYETQFCAVTFILEDGSIYVAYRGTDETIVGWKEDFNMTFMSPIPGQELSVKYLNSVTGKWRKKFYVGGHSKGGNLATYAAMNCKDHVRERIIKVYNMDGPGFRPEVLEDGAFEEIRDRMVKLIPHSSAVGLIFERDMYYQVVESKAFGLWQHNPYSWIVEGTDFKKVSSVYEGRKFIDETFSEWVLSLEEEQCKTFVDTVFKIISASESDNLIDFTANLTKSIKGMGTALKEVDETTAKMIKEMLLSLLEVTKQNMIGKIKSITEKEED